MLGLIAPAIAFVRRYPMVFAALGLLIALVIAFFVIKGMGAREATAKRDRADAAAIVAAAERNAKATGLEAKEATTDAATVAAHTEELKDAIQAVPDSVPDGPALGLACGQLRRQGVDLRTVPACLAFAGPAQAPTDGR